MKKTSSLIEDKRKDKVQRTHTLRNPKTHPTGEFVIVAENGGCALLRLASRLANVVSERVSKWVSE